MRRQRIELNDAPRAADQSVNVDDEFASLLDDVQRIKEGQFNAAVPHKVIGEVADAPGWVQVQALDASAEATSEKSQYYWHPASGQVSWQSPAGRDALRSLEDAQAAVKTALKRCKPGSQHAATAAAQASLLAAVAREQRRRPMEHCGSAASEAWRAVHSVFHTAAEDLQAEAAQAAGEAAALAPAAVGVAAAATNNSRAGGPFNHHPPAAIAVLPAVQGSDDDMELSEGEVPAGPRPASAAAVGVATAPPGALKKKRAGSAGSGVPGASSSRKRSKAAGVGRKATAALLSRWATAAKDMAGSEGESDEGDEAQERRRAREADDWRAAQIRSGAAGDNSNFAPVVGDWRDRVKSIAERRNRSPEGLDNNHGNKTNGNTVEGAGEATEEAGAAGGGGETAAEAAEAQQPSAAASVDMVISHTMPDLAALSAGLPPNWQAMWDSTSGGVYYGNLSTNVTSWERPSA